MNAYIKGRYTRKIDMLHGSLWDKILIVALPFALTGIMQQLFMAADIAMLGQLVGKEAMAAVGSNSSIIATTLSLFIGISLGANVVIAGFIGQRNEKGVHDAVHTAVLVALICGLVMTVIGELITRPLLVALAVPAELLDMAVMYLRIYLLGMPVILLYNFESSIFRSQGDTRTPLICLVISGLVKVVLNLAFILQLGMTVDGVATGTVIVNLISSSLLFYFLRRSKSTIAVHMQDFRIDKKILKRMLQIGVPAGLQGMVFSLSNICIQSAINSLGADVMAASAAAFNIEIFAYFIINAFGQVCTTFTSQNYGARQLERCRQVMKISMIQDLLFSAAICGLLVWFGIPLLHLFNTDGAVVALGFIRLKYVAGLEVINTVIEIISGSMRGYGNSLIPAVITFFGICGTRITWVYTIFQTQMDFEILMIVFPVSWIVTAAAICVAYKIFMKQLNSDMP